MAQSRAPVPGLEQCHQKLCHQDHHKAEEGGRPILLWIPIDEMDSWLRPLQLTKMRVLA